MNNKNTTPKEEKDTMFVAETLKENILALTILLILKNSTGESKNIDSIVEELKKRGANNKYEVDDFYSEVEFLKFYGLVIKDVNYTPFEAGGMPESVLLLSAKGADVLDRLNCS